MYFEIPITPMGWLRHIGGSHMKLIADTPCFVHQPTAIAHENADLSLVGVNSKSRPSRGWVGRVCTFPGFMA